MEIIKSKYLEYNIGIDIGDHLIINLLDRYNILPTSNTIIFSIPILNIEYTFNLYIGNSILSKNCFFIESIKIKSPEYTIYIETSVFNNCIYIIKISTKTILLFYHVYILPNQINVIETNENIDIYNYKLKFQLTETIKIIKNKIQNSHIILTNEDIILLNLKFTEIINKLDILNNQKLLDIKNNLSNKFFL
jgi:hypothetical protein